MKAVRLVSIAITLALATALVLPAPAQELAGQRIAAAEFEMIEAAQNAANAMAGPRTVPGRSIQHWGCCATGSDQGEGDHGTART